MSILSPIPASTHAGDRTVLEQCLDVTAPEAGRAKFGDVLNSAAEHDGLRR
ncbi:hypothetical protein [Subtercola boreus]|uniref:hypothetical protein n=1 Tax=Subtercola boreus TaxID=120213 RepID=UPI00155841B9|nr:hypothetical protein [Subtercola boreus]